MQFLKLYIKIWLIKMNVYITIKYVFFCGILDKDNMV
jgi:hypothetical protein